MAAFMGILTGILTRTLVPFLVALRKNPHLKWNSRYLISAIAGLLLSLVASYVIFIQTDHSMTFGTAFLTAYTLQSVSREAQKLVE